MNATSSRYPQPDAAFEEYLFYAALQRQEEENDILPANPEITVLSDEGVHSTSKTANFPKLPPMTADQVERAHAARAIRLASWLSVFYLLTTDIFGPFNAPYAISQLGWVPGILLFIISSVYFLTDLAGLFTSLSPVGIVSTYSNILLWKLYLGLDSLRYPLKSYGDITGRIYGRVLRRVCNLLQAVQLIFNVGGICLALGQSLSQIVQGRLCFSVCVVIFIIIGMIIGQIRLLKNFSWLAMSTLWINIAIMCISMGAIAHSAPNYPAVQRSLGINPGPVITQNFVSLPLYLKVNGVMNMVFAYSGAMIFPEIMAEMKRPMDFWKNLALVQTIILTAYLIYGCFIYKYQGQFSLPLAYQGVSAYVWQTAGNGLSIVVGMIAAGLYGNIAIKTIYTNVIEDMLKGPRLLSPKGRIVWAVTVVIYWAIAFVIGSAIPQIQTVIGLLSAIAIMQFSYTFPPLLWFGYQVMTDAMSADKAYVPCNDTNRQKDTWSDWSRWRRGLFGGRWYLKGFNLALGLAGIATACLGMWGAGEAMKATFACKNSR